MQELFDILRDFRDSRGWRKYHTPKNLSVSIAIEAAELLELFQWTRSVEDEMRVLEERGRDVEEEIADILIYALFLCDVAGIDPLVAVKRKMEKNERKYPKDRVHEF
ncbi:nucleotide pyrophosphohydrolase [Archaeoglobus sp.]